MLDAPDLRQRALLPVYVWWARAGACERAVTNLRASLAACQSSQQALIDGALPAAQALNASIAGELEGILPLTQQAESQLLALQEAGSLTTEFITATMNQLVSDLGGTTQAVLGHLDDCINNLPTGRTGQPGQNTAHVTGSAAGWTKATPAGNTGSNEAAGVQGTVPATP